MCEDHDLLISTAEYGETSLYCQQDTDEGARESGYKSWSQEWLRRLFLAWMSEAMSNGDFGMSNSRVRGKVKIFDFYVLRRLPQQP